jgi:hypothetical protein
VKVAFPSPDFTLSAISGLCVSNDTPSINQNSFFVAAESFSQTEKHSCAAREHSTELPERPILPAPPAELVMPGIISRIRAVIGRIKAHPGYTDAIGEQLQIVGSKTDDLNVAEAKPTFKAAPSVGKVTLDWTKGDLDGVVIEGQRGAETTYTLLDKDFKSPFVDMRPNLTAGQPEVRRYRMIYLLDDAVVGTYSNEVAITTMA